MLNFGKSLIKPARWPIQPRLTAASWGPDTIVWPFWEGGGSTTYAIGASGLYGDLNGDNCTFGVGSRGRAVQSVQGSPEPYVNINVSNPGRLPTGDNPLTLTVAFEATELAGGSKDSATLFAIRGSNNDDNGFSLRIENGGELWWRTYGGNNGGTSAVVSANTFHVATGVWTPGTGVKIFLDGKLIQNDTTLTDGNPGGENNWQAAYGIDWGIDDTPYGTTQDDDGVFDTEFSGFFYLGAHDFRALTDDAVKQRHADIFAMLRPGSQAIPTLFGDAGAAGGLVSLSGATSATTALSGRLSAQRSVQGAAAATSDLSGVLSARRAVTGTAAAQTTTQGTLSARRSLAGTTAAQTTTQGRVSIRRAISGVVTATTTLTGALSKSAKVLLSGSVQAVTNLSGRLSARRGVAGTAQAQTTTSGRISVRRAVSGAVAATTSLTGKLGISRLVSGAVNVVTTLAGVLTIGAATKRFSSVGRTQGKLASDGRTRGKLRFSGRTKGK